MSLLAFRVAAENSGPNTDTVNDGSDVYMQMASDDLMIADNSSFSNSSEAFENMRDVDTNYSTIYAYNGSLVDQQ